MTDQNLLRVLASVDVVLDDELSTHSSAVESSLFVRGGSPDHHLVASTLFLYSGKSIGCKIGKSQYIFTQLLYCEFSNYTTCFTFPKLIGFLVT